MGCIRHFKGGSRWVPCVLMDTHVCSAGFITLRHLKGVSPTYIERQTFKICVCKHGKFCLCNNGNIWCLIHFATLKHINHIRKVLDCWWYLCHVSPRDSTHFYKVQEILPISVQTLIPLLNYYHSHNQGRIWCLIGRGGELSRQSHPLYFLPLFFEIQTILFLDCFKKNILSFNAHVTDFTKWICHSNFLLVHCFTKSVSTLSFLK